MNPITADEFAEMEDTAESTFFDECYILRRSTTTDDFGEEQETWIADDDPVECGFEPTGAPTQIYEALEVTDIDARLRLPIGTDVDRHDHIRMTERLGQSITAEEYDVVSAPRRGPSALVLDLKRVAT
jgi:hypothetical protein